jgi:hypothetical protein
MFEVYSTNTCIAISSEQPHWKKPFASNISSTEVHPTISVEINSSSTIPEIRMSLFVWCDLPQAKTA